MKNQPKIRIKMSNYGERGWRWIAEFTDQMSDERVTIEQRTNAGGQGLWACGDVEDKQISGTCQFSLSSDRRRARGELRRYIERDYLTV